MGEEIMEIRVKEIMDVTSFWAQIGSDSARHLDAFDKHQKEMSIWCEACTICCHKVTSSDMLGNIVAVRKEAMSWVRAKIIKIISDRQVELFYVDNGSIGYADVSDICAESPPMLCAMPQQALQCLLSGVEMLEGDKHWSDEAKSRFTQLVSTPTKALIHHVLEGHHVVLSIYAPYKGQYLSIGEVLKREGLAKYQPLGPLYLDLPLPCKLSDSNENDDQTTIPLQDYRNDVSSFTPDNGSCSSSLSEEELKLERRNSNITITPVSTPIMSYRDGMTLQDGNDSPNTIIEAIPPPSLLSRAVQEKCEKPGYCESNENTVPKTEYSEDLVSQHTENASDCEKTGTLFSSQDKLSLVSDLIGEDSSGSSLSDTDWLNEDLLPHKSENSESSDAIESSWKGDCVVEQNITPGSSGRLRDDTSSGKLRDDTSSGRLQDDASSGRLRDGGSSGRLWGNASSGRLRDEAGSGRLRDEAGSGRLQTEVATKTKWRSNPIKHGSPGHTPHPSRHLYTPHDLTRWLSRDLPRGRGQGKFRNDTTANKNIVKRDLFPKGRGKGRGQGRSQGTRESMPWPATSRQTREVATSITPKTLSMSLELSPTTEKKPLAISTPTVAQTDPSTVLKINALDESSYHQLIQGRTKEELIDEVKWQVRKMENSIDKILKSLNPENVSDFSEEIEKLLQGSTAEKLRKLPKSRYPQEVIIQYIVKNGIFSCQDLSLLATAVKNMVEGSCGEEACGILQSAINKMAYIAEYSSGNSKEERSRKCHAFCQFLGSLFISSSSSSGKCRDLVVSCVNHCLETWCSFVPLQSYQGEQQKKLQIECFGSLLYYMDFSLHGSDWNDCLIRLLNGPIKESILSEYQPRYIRDAWFSELVKIFEGLLKESTITSSPKVTTDHKEIPADDLDTVNSSVHQVESNQNQVLVPYHNMESNQNQVLVPYHNMESNQNQVLVPYHNVESDQDQVSVPYHNMESGQDLVVASYPQQVHSQILMPHTDMSTPNSSITSLTRCESQEFPHSSYTISSGNELSEYAQVSAMLETLHLTELLPKFKEAMIKDSVFEWDVQTVRSCLKDAGIPSGAIVELVHYLECYSKIDHQIHQHSLCSKPSSPIIPRSMNPPYPHFQYWGHGNAYNTPYYNMGQQQQQQQQHQQQQQQMVSPYQLYSNSTVRHLYGVTPVGTQQYTEVTKPALPMMPMTPYQVKSPLVTQQQQPQQQHLTQLNESKKEIEEVASSLATGEIISQTSVKKSAPSAHVTPPEQSKLDYDFVARKPHSSVQSKSPPSNFPPLVARKLHSSVQQTETEKLPNQQMGFGSINCVLCGGVDHFTSNCTARNRFFTHM